MFSARRNVFITTFVFFGIFFGIGVLISCSTPKKISEPASTSVNAVYIMTYNVENLFDTKDEAQKNDETFLPLKLKRNPSHQKKCAEVKQKHWREQCLYWDWNDDVLHTKMLRLSQAVRQANSGRGPDILLLQEVENIDVLKQWNQNYLADLGYKYEILIEGRDARGIDVALLSRLALKNPAQLHHVAYKGADQKQKADTRGILQADFILPDGETLTVFNVHFPAPFHPIDLRRQSFEALGEKLKALPQGRLAIAAGDFNVPSEEDHEHQILKEKAEDLWIVAHKKFCSGCKGTTYYPPKNSWSFLDMILLSKSFNNSDSPWRINETSFKVLNAAEKQTTQEGYPAAFDPSGPNGVSDHWPLGIRIENLKTD